MTNYYTIIGKSVTCPQYNKTVVLSAKYRFTGNPENEYNAATTRSHFEARLSNYISTGINSECYTATQKLI